MNLNYQSIGRRIREERLTAKISQAALAEKADVSPQYISLVENGKKQISLTVLVHIAAALSVSTDQLLFDPCETRTTRDPEFDALMAGCSSCERKIITDIALAAKRSLMENRQGLYHIV